MNYCVLDFETASACDLKKAGAFLYSEDVTTEVICLAMSKDGEAPLVFYDGDLQYRPDHPLALLIAQPHGFFIAHNCLFEKSIWRNIMMVQYGWPDIPDKRWHDTLAVCNMKSLPGSLDKAAIILRLREGKDMVGHKLTMSLSKPKRGYYDRSEATLKRVYSYCKQDIRTEDELFHRVGPMQARERDVWLLDQRINWRGVRVDPVYIGACEAVVDGAMRPLLREFDKLTDGLAPTQVKKVLEWCSTQGVKVDNLKKETIAKMLGADDGEEADEETVEGGDPWEAGDEGFTDSPLFDLPEHVRRALEIRRVCGSASIKKLRAMRACIASDGRVRGAVQYHGATTGRWAGRLFQPHNFPRPTLTVGDVDKDGKPIRSMVKWRDIFDAIMTRDVDYIGLQYGDPIEVVISGLRHAIISSPGRDLCIGDLKTIEARIVLALAGQYDKVKLIAEGKDIYVDMAKTIYHMEIDKDKNPKERTVGKQTVLGAGFGMGAEKFQKNYAQNESLDFCKKVITAYRTEFAPEVPKLWYGLEDAATRTAWDRTPHEYAGVRYAIEDCWMTARLPSGRKLYYYDPQPDKRAMKWDETDIRPMWTFKAQKLGRWRTIDAYGGQLTENVVSGLARDILVAGLFRCEKNNLPVVLTVHDETIAEPLTQHSDRALLEQLMSEREDWAVALQIPVGADTWCGDHRYRK